MSEIEKYYNGEIIVDFEEETELEKKYNEVAELYSKAVKKKIEYRKEIERLKEELEIRDILIKGIDKRIDNHFRKIDRCVFEDTNKLIEIQDLIKKAMGSDKE